MQPIDRSIVELAESYRSEVPRDLLVAVDNLEADMSNGRPIEILMSRGRGGRTSAERIKAAVLKELSLLLCSNDPRYDGVRMEGNKITKDAVHFIAGVIVGALGLTAGTATGCVAFVALACAKVGVETFCRLNPPDLDAVARGRRRSAG